MLKFNNSHGKIFYGMHFYPGVAEYREPDSEPFRVFLNEDTIRSMDPTFAGRPIFVEHVDGVDDDIDKLKKEADGWVIESFFNQADGKHWVKFIVVSKKAEQAIRSGMRLSNAYIPKSYSLGGLWNGVSYEKEITSGEYEHLAIVRNPRYEESIIMTPEEFKSHNEEQLSELKRLSNSKDSKGDTKMAFKLFKRAKVENAVDLETMCVELPKSKKEMTLAEVINELDTIKNMDGYANMEHMVKLHDGSEMKVGELVSKHKAMCDEMEKAKGEETEENADSEIEEGEKEVGDRGGDKGLDNEEDEAAKKKAMAEDKDKELDDAKKKNALDVKTKAKEKADKLKKAHLNALQTEEVEAVEFSDDRLARGKARYGA